MKRLVFSIFLLLLQATAVLVQAQQGSTSSVSVGPSAGVVRFYVDGQFYTSRQVFTWPTGSKHILEFAVQQLPDGSTALYQQSLDGQYRYQFGGWTDSTGQTSPAPVYTVTANPAVTSITAIVTVQVRVSVLFSSDPSGPVTNCGAPGNPPQDGNRPGVVSIGGTCIGSNLISFQPVGPVPISAFPYPGYVFYGYSVNGVFYSSYVSTVTVNGPTVINPIFLAAKRVKFVTNPYGLQLLIDRSPTPTSSGYLVDPNQPYGTGVCTPDPYKLPPLAPAGLVPLCYGEFDFLPGSTHILAAPDSQVDGSGQLYVLDSFSTGGAQNTVYTAGQDTTIKDTVVANFIRGVRASFVTVPGNLNLQIDGRTNWPGYNFVWGTGTQHTIVAPATQTIKGRTYTFVSWSNGGGASQTVSPDIAVGTLRLTANFALLAQATITSNQPGVSLTVDGTVCKTPCVIDHALGSQVQITAPDSIPLGLTARLDFAGFSDGINTSTRSLSFNADTQNIFVNYQTSYKLTETSDPAGGADFVNTPASADGFYTSGTAVSVVATARPGFKFRRFAGDLTGTYNGGVVVMSAPHTVIALLDRVPFIPPAGIKNAAGDTPDGTIAPGSILAIYGESLAPGLAVGPTNPLAQTISNVTVSVNDRVLPLLFVSPQQINAQLFSDVPDGIYTLKVQAPGNPDILGTFTVARNSPGLFAQVINGQLYTVALHADGTPITADSPAIQGEVITVYGTGFGPYTKPVVDGFAADASQNPLVDPLQITAGDIPLDTIFAGAGSGYVGTSIVQFRITSVLPSGSTVPLKVTVNGKTSNSVLLPLK